MIVCLLALIESNVIWATSTGKHFLEGYISKHNFLQKSHHIGKEFKSPPLPSPKLQKAWGAMKVISLDGICTFSAPSEGDTTMFGLVIWVKQDHPKEPWLFLSLQIT